jgi:hypothetical protein
MVKVLQLQLAAVRGFMLKVLLITMTRFIIHTKREEKVRG